VDSNLGVAFDARDRVDDDASGHGLCTDRSGIRAEQKFGR
jgi:hypothetical protein